MSVTSAVVQEGIVLVPSVSATTPQLGEVGLSHLSATSSTLVADVSVGTVQGSGVSVFNVAAAHCIHAFSVPASTVFGGSAVLLPLQTTPEPATTEPSSEDAAATPTADDLAAFVYVPIAASADAGKKHSSRRVWIWAVGARAKAAKIVGKPAAGGPGKPDWVKNFDVPLHSIAAHGSRMLIIFHSNASIVLMKHDLQRPISSLKKTGTDLVLWNQTRSVENSDKLIATESLSIIKLEDSKIVARLSRIETKLSATGADDSHSITTNDFSLDFKDPITPIAYAFVADQKKLFVALSNAQIQCYSLKSNTLTSVLNIDSLSLACFSPSKKIVKGIPLPFSMQVIADSYLAIVGLVVGKSGEQDLLSVWDTRFGTLQLKRVLNSDEAITSTSDPLALTAKQPFFGRTYNIEPTHSSLSGPVLSISTSNLRSLPSDNTVSFNTSVSLYPFYCPPVSLLTAFGKLASSLKFSLEAGKEGTLAGLATVAQAPPHKTTALNNWFTGLTHLEDLDRTYVARITAATVTVDTMALELARWIYEKTTLTSPSTKLEKPTGDPHAINLTTMPIIEISQPAMAKLLTRALENPKTFYPTRVLQYLIRTGRVPACISVPDGSPVDPPRSISIIEQVLLQNDFQTLCLLLQDENGGCLGINEYDVLAIVQYVCCVPANEGEVGIMERRRNTIDVFVKSQVGSNKNAAYKKCLVKQDAGAEAVDTTGATTKMFDGRRWFFEKCFAIPQQNDFEFAKALKNLNVDQVGVVMAWVVGLLEVDVRLKTEVARKKTAVQKRKDLAAAAAAARASGSQKKKHLAIEAAAAVAEKFAFVDDMMERDLNQCLAENEVRRQLWWLWDTPGKKNEYSDAVCQAIDVINLIIDVHLTTILLTPSLHELVQRLKACINSDLHVFDMMQRKLNGCLSAFELSEVAKNKAAASVAGLSGDQKIAKKQEVVGTELRKRWKRMVAQVNDGVGTYAVEVMGI